VDDQVPERRHIIFDPIPRVDGSESSGDPLTEVHADISLLSGRRWRAVCGDGRLWSAERGRMDAKEEKTT
jgi:hypothetical protein